MIDTSEGLQINEDHRVSRSLVTKLRIAVTRPLFRLTRGMTLGSRTAVIDGQGRFLLVKQTYTAGWIFPGGGVERGETCEEAALREVEEEAGVYAKGPLEFKGIFSNDKEMRGDHLAFYILRDFEQRAFSSNMEIADARFFHAHDLPDRVNGGSRRRIAEIIEDRPVSLHW
jgi:8-oxo-dGTP pyrophosphatase MutT (NUDIX family)